MISLYFFLIIVFITIINHLILNLYSKISNNFLLSIFFGWNSLFVIALLEYIYYALPTLENLDFSQIEVILSLNINLTNYRNTLIVFILTYLTYGLYSEFLKSNKKIYIVLTIIIGIMSLLMFFLSLLAGSFTI